MFEMVIIIEWQFDNAVRINEMNVTFYKLWIVHEFTVHLQHGFTAYQHKTRMSMYFVLDG